MADVHTKEQRSYNMSRIKGKGTKPEIVLRKFMKSLGFTYHPKGITGNPDFANRKEKIALFIDGCFWHRCPIHFREPESNKDYWTPKLKRNSERDREKDKSLRKDGWKVLRIWEHDVKKYFPKN